MGKEKPGLGQLNVKIPQAYCDEFNRWIDETGYHKWKSIVGALLLLRYSPPELRDLAMAGNDRAVRRWFSQAVQARKADEVEVIVERVVERRLAARLDDRQMEDGGKGQSDPVPA